MDIPLISNDDILDYIDKKIPFIIKSIISNHLDSVSWHNEITLDFLRHCIGDLNVSAHYSNEKVLTFYPKNFSYQLVSINKLLDEIISNIKNPETYIYYRSLGKRPQKDPSRLEDLSIDLYNKFKLPQKFEDLLNDGLYKVHSTILRISHPEIELWTHYDVFDNILIQTMGSKQVTLFEPSAIADLKISLSTSPLIISQLLKEESRHKDLFDKSYRGVLTPGDSLYIPSCWPHSIKCTGSSYPCVSFNCFLETFHIKSVYGNDDPYQIRDSLKLLDKIDSMIDDLPWTLKVACWSKISLKAREKCDDIMSKLRR